MNRLIKYLALTGSAALLLACGGGGGGGAGGVNLPAVTLQSQLPEVTSSEYITAGLPEALNGSVQMASISDRFNYLLASMKEAIRNGRNPFIGNAFAADTSACIDQSMALSGAVSEAGKLNWRLLKIVKGASSPCITAVQDSRNFIIITAANIGDASGKLCDLIFISKSDGALKCERTDLGGGAVVTKYNIGSNVLPDYSAQVSFGRSRLSAHTSQNGKFLYVPYVGQDGGKIVRGVVAFNIESLSVPSAGVVLLKTQGSVNLMQGMENGDLWVNYQICPNDKGGCDGTESYIRVDEGVPREVIFGRLFTTSSNKIPQSSLTLMGDYFRSQLDSQTPYFNTYQVIPGDGSGGLTRAIYFNNQGWVVKAEIDNNGAVTFEGQGRTLVNYYFFSEGGSVYGVRSFDNSTGDQCWGYSTLPENGSAGYDAQDCTFYVVRHSLRSGSSGVDEKVVPLFAVGKNAWDYVPIIRTAGKIYVLNYNDGNYGDPFFGQNRFWNGKIPLPPSVYVVDAPVGQDGSWSVAQYEVPSANASNTQLKAIQISYGQNELVMKGTRGGSPMMAVLGTQGLRSQQVYSNPNLLSDGIQVIKK